MPTPSPVEDDDLPELVDYEPQAYVPPPNDAPSPTAGPNTVHIDLLRSSWTSPGRVPLHAVLLCVTDSWLETFYELRVPVYFQDFASTPLGHWKDVVEAVQNCSYGLLRERLSEHQFVLLLDFVRTLERLAIARSCNRGMNSPV
ncbi:uncharacterized protein TRAVEDRAFT_48085 [Trametes versicolor FP-101664 SS1]|uniref:uncharacterized protein n=1 Tax=Trametes versicolor (strain FP-101664) TaxID=717944 RepID=UPI00046240F5|nr:uncharacterized protein TRAVEDRAFT_48085 [Trametes versicolor FP-101664 SS1]EIW58951.1 hypothetical protein TRAVEDRAFT_48085 [Trametes versicolor FP-101664 SS1]